MSPSMSLIRTRAPSRQKSSAVARPIPRAEPVMIALLPSSSPIQSSFDLRGPRDSIAGENGLQRAGDHEALDLVGPLVDLRDLGIAHHPLDRVVADIAVAAEH